MLDDEKELHGILERKLTSRLKIIDDKVLAKIRAEWNGICPGPNCRDIGSIMAAVRQITSTGLKERAEEAKQVVSETVSGFRGVLSDEFVSSSKHLVRKQVSNHAYAGAAARTLDIFRRRQAPASKSSNHVFEHEMALVKVDCINRVRRSLEMLDTVLDELVPANRLAQRGETEEESGSGPSNFLRREAQRRGHLWLLIAFAISTAIGLIALWM